MTDVARVFATGRSQAVRLPLAYRFDCPAVFIRRDPATGDVILSRRPHGWSDFFAPGAAQLVPEDFLSPQDRAQGQHPRDPLAGET